MTRFHCLLQRAPFPSNTALLRCYEDATEVGVLEFPSLDDARAFLSACRGDRLVVVDLLAGAGTGDTPVV